jgi:hypothetical protein
MEQNQKVFRKIDKGTGDYIGKAVDCFLSGQTGKFDRYIAVENALVYRVVSHVDGKSRVRQNIIAVRLKSGEVIGNSSALGLIGRTVSFGRERENRGVTEVQTRLNELVTMIPFNVFTEANLNLNSFKILARGSEETVVRRVPNPKFERWNEKSKQPEFLEETAHFTGASLFSIDDKIFLFDIDRREIEHKIFNAFLVEVPDARVKTIAEAYESLKPLEVKTAESEGLKVLRQGEWFFIPVQGEFEAVKGSGRWDKKEFEPLTLQAGQNRPNSAHRYARDGKGHVVSGYVEHSGREHAKLILKGWFKPVTNTATRSFTITGDVD